MKTILLWAACLVIVTGCNSPQNHHSPIENGGTKTVEQAENFNPYGTYEGILPAADCEGIKTTLTLNNNKTYVLRSEYIGGKNAIFKSKGSYAFINGSLIELTQSSSNEKSYYKILDGSKVMLSDKEGTINQGILAEHYILKKK
ncbi:copper resistance protein NlpE [uncultured Akkermansia sp.]|uniref:copper resistance protein NlpE n=1 Tax=uncultured Akkermansia sp. TaxID=512294 RepID=UPI00261A3FB6|nr:copper resistance protein NlpE [uncultured Akkermansia sp.]